MTGKFDYEQFYSRISVPFRKHPAFIRALNLLNRCLTGTVYVVYPLFLMWLIWKRDSRWIRAAAVPAVFFVLLSAVRKKIDRPRPYETWNLSPLIKKDTRGHSMPSRHIFSSAVISMAFLSVCVPMGIFFLIWTCLLAVIRVLGGVHYPSDVACGLLAGILSGLLMFV
ncbi:MAG: phosphatase PAP2 family protein [Lachnospiraceae bacterium]|nr:phosphatase PAP2 family protein [Lachnospiraceae bacterium]MDY4970494.1 phosphatase PAP2 family protein [Lachnospiraceae bacterium]